MRSFLMSACLLMVLVAPAASQSGSLRTGQRIRIGVRSARAITGNLTAIDRDTLAVEAADRLVTHVALRDVQFLQKSRGLHGNSLALGVLGLAAGTVIGLALANSASTGKPLDYSGAGYIVLVPIGAVVGAVAGTAIRSERWQKVPRDDWRVALGFGADSNGNPQLRLALGWSGQGPRH